VFKRRAPVVEIGFIAGLGIDVLPLRPPEVSGQALRPSGA